MNHKKKMLFLLSLAVLSIVQTQTAHATVDLSEFPTRLGESLGLTTLAGQMLASTLVFALFLFPTMLLTSKRKNQDIAVIIVTFLVSVTLIAFAWMPYWILILETLVIAVLYAGKVKNWLTSGG